MPSRAQSITITYTAWDTAANAGKTGDVANHTLKWIKDGTPATPTNAAAEVDSTNAPGVYKLVLTTAECTCDFGCLAGKSSTAGISIIPAPVSFEQLPTAAPAASGGLPTLDANLRVSANVTLLSNAVWQVLARLLYKISGAVIHAMKTGNDSTGDGSIAAPYLTVFKAKSVAADQDAIVVGPGTFAETTNKIDLSLGHTGSVHLFGAGMGVTTISSTVPSSSGPCIEWGSSIISDLTIQGLIAAPSLQYPLGATGSSRVNKVQLYNVEVLGVSDGIYTENNTGAGSTIFGRNIRIRSNYDCVNLVDNVYSGSLFDVDFEASGHFATFGKHRAICSAGNLTIFSGRLSAIHDDANNQYAAAVEAGQSFGSGATTISVMPGVVLHSETAAGGTNFFDVAANHYAGGPQAVIYTAAGIGSGTGGALINGLGAFSEEVDGSVKVLGDSIVRNITTYVRELSVTSS